MTYKGYTIEVEYDKEHIMTTSVKETKEKSATPFEQNVVIPPDRRLTIKIPDEIPTGDARITVTIKYGKKPNRLGEVFGIGKGTTWMADDFDAPLEDFEEYM